MKREAVSVAEKGYEGVAVGPIPGSTPSTEVYVPVNGRVYRINVYSNDVDRPGLDEEDRRLLSGLRFSPPSRSVASLGIPRANAPGTLYTGGNGRLVEREQSAHEAASARGTKQPEMSLETPVLSRSGVVGETRIAEGCWRANPRFFFQTQHGKYANRRWGSKWTGWTIIGRPNFWGQYTHGDLDYGRCASNYYTNDKFAVDYPLGRGDVVFSPFRRGTVTFAGRNTSHKNYGIFVVIKAKNGKYVSMSAHLNGLANGIRRGKVVTRDTVIGFAGSTGDPSIPVGETHLHQAYYRYPHYLRDGSPYGGRACRCSTIATPAPRPARRVTLSPPACTGSARSSPTTGPPATRRIPAEKGTGSGTENHTLEAPHPPAALQGGLSLRGPARVSSRLAAGGRRYRLRGGRYTAAPRTPCGS